MFLCLQFRYLFCCGLKHWLRWGDALCLRVLMQGRCCWCGKRKFMLSVSILSWRRGWLRPRLRPCSAARVEVFDSRDYRIPGFLIIIIIMTMLCLT
ncbi:hypothetical protein DL98DRAFT_206375 [Cadophora sp. DSE1049]|nr:hypothetical protein DL98DRAFT_206375 [Cadophora sp. DSE1049]